jgi:hypothetical protein
MPIGFIVHGVDIETSGALWTLGSVLNWTKHSRIERLSACVLLLSGGDCGEVQRYVKNRLKHFISVLTASRPLSRPSHSTYSNGMIC